MLARTGVPAVVAVSLLNTAAALTAPAALARAVDGLRAGAPSTGAVLMVAAAVLVAAATDGLVRLADQYCSAAGTAALRRALLGRVLALGAPVGRRFGTGDLVARAVSDTAEAGGGGVAVAQSAGATIAAAAGLVALAVLDVRLALAFLLGVPAGLALLRLFVRRTTTLARDYQDAQGEIATGLVDALAGSRTIAAAGSAGLEADRVLRPLPRLHRAGLALWDNHGRLAGWALLLAPLLQVGVLAVAGYGVSAGWLSLGQLVAAGAYLGLALGFLDQAGPLARLAQARASAARLVEVLDGPVPAAGTRDLPPGPGRLEFRGVSAAADGVPVLSTVDLVVPGGTTLAVVGASGAGKSLLGALAARLLDPDAGTVLLDGVPLPALDPAALRAAVGVAFERPVLLGDTLADAIVLGRPGAAAAAARAAQVDGVILRMPGGYGTPLAGAPLSGGEAQRLGIARALATGPRLLVLDDALSSVDTITEARLRGSLPAGTRLVLTHRASTAAAAGTVAWLEGGRIRALGPHHELTADPAYRALFAGAGLAAVTG
jgi:ATP-binding cassette, subfamily B, bacterial